MMSDLNGRVSISKCAVLLTAAGDRIDRSALSRYCDAHGLKLAQLGKAVLVDFASVRAHRAENLQREVMSGQAVPSPQAAPVLAAASANQVVSSMPEHRELKAVALRHALREEAKEEGLLTETAEAEAGAAEAIVQMRSAFAAERTVLAEKMVARLGLKPEHVRPIRDFLRQYDRLGQTRFAQVMAKALADGNEETSEAHLRLTALAAASMRLRARRNPAYARAASVA